jgi:streptogramin lyase
MELATTPALSTYPLVVVHQSIIRSQLHVTPKDAGPPVVASAARLSPPLPAGRISDYVLSDTATTFALAAGSDTSVWFAESTPPRIGRLTPDGAVSLYSLPGFQGVTSGLTVGPDQTVWFGLWSGSKAYVGRIAPSGVYTEFALHDYGRPLMLTAGPDGSVWMPQIDTSRVVEISLDGFEYDYQFFPGSGDTPAWMVARDSGVWFADWSGVGLLSNVGSRYRVRLPGIGKGIDTSPDGHVWVSLLTGPSTGWLQELTTSGQLVTTYRLSIEPALVAADSKGTIWFTGSRFGCGCDGDGHQLGEAANGTFQTFRTSSSTTDTGLVAKSDSVWFSTDRGVSRYIP